MRLNRYLASCGVASRRKCDQLIEEAKVTVNGATANIGTVVDPSKDTILVNGEPVKEEQKAYYLFYKPLNVLTTLSDPHGRRTIVEYLEEIDLRLFPVGRLDYDSEGLLLLTNDGALAHRTQHPKYEIEKEYIVSVSQKLTSSQEELFRTGIKLEEGQTRECFLQLMGLNVYKVIIHQGWHRQIRRMFDSFGVSVTSLKRIRVGNLELKDLIPGQYRPVADKEIRQFRKMLFC